MIDSVTPEQGVSHLIFFHKSNCTLAKLIGVSSQDSSYLWESVSGRGKERPLGKL